MDNRIDDELVANLQAFSAKGVAPTQAQAAMRNAGYTLDEIEAAAIAARHQDLERQAGGVFDANNVTSQTQAIIALSNAKGVDQEVKLRDETMIAGMVGGVNPYTAPYLERYYSNLGLSFWKITLAHVAIVGLFYFGRFPSILIGLVGIVFSGYVTFVFIMRFFWK